MPNASQGYKPNVGDTYVITGIKLPNAYIKAAEERLDAAVRKGMKDSNDEKFIFSIKFSRIFIALNDQFSHILNENTQLTVRYDDTDYPFYVSNYTCKADENILCEINVELSDMPSVSQSDLKTQLDSIKTDILSALSGKQNSASIDKALRYFIRKDIPDTARGLITFLNGLKATVKSNFDGGLEVGEFIDSMLAGKGAGIMPDGRMQLDRLEVRGSMTVMDLVVNMLQGMAADYSFSDLGKITQVDDLGDGTYKLWLEKRTDYDFTTFGEGDVCYSIVNTLYKGGTDYFTSWMRLLKTP